MTATRQTPRPPKRNRHPSHLVAAPLPVKRIASHLALDPERPDDDQQRRIDRTSAETLTLLETLMSCAPVGFGFVDRDFRMLRLNERLAAVNGSTVADQLGRKVCDITPELWPTIEPAYRQVLTTGEAIVNFEISGTSAESPGRTRHWLDSWYPVRIDDEIVGIGIVVVDVTERFEAETAQMELTHEFEQKLTHQSLHDALTGLPNRDLLRHRMGRAAANAGYDKHSILFLDCDDFKRVNDTFGHAAGDRYLIEVSERFVASVRPEDTVARLGGDEFAILLEGTGIEGATIAAKRIVGALSPPIIIEGRAVHPSASIGLASGKLDASHPETLLADADLAMYFAKRAGKGEYRVFAEQMRTQTVDRLELGEDLRQAVESASLQVEYQPIIDLLTGRIVGVEALARWDHASRGWVGPDTFIPIAEELGLVERIDQWVLREACTAGRSWIEDGLHEFKMAVNLSGRDLEQPDLVEQIARILHETAFPAGQLGLELTEGVAINESSGAQQTLEALKSLGVHLAIDDFGTGYSALSRLRNLPFDRLKVDKAFVDDIDRVEQGSRLVDTILEMAHVLGLEVVAEGVETATQVDYLRERGCQFGQGFLFGKPMGRAAMTTLLKRHSS